ASRGMPTAPGREFVRHRTHRTFLHPTGREAVPRPWRDVPAVTVWPMTPSSPLVSRLQPFGTSVFSEMTQRALQFDAVNLGQGFPDTEGPAEMVEVAARGLREGLNQYAPARGLPVLRQAVAAHQDRFYGIPLDPDTQVLV